MHGNMQSDLSFFGSEEEQLLLQWTWAKRKIVSYRNKIQFSHCASIKRTFRERGLVPLSRFHVKIRQSKLVHLHACNDISECERVAARDAGAGGLSTKIHKVHTKILTFLHEYVYILYDEQIRPLIKLVLISMYYFMITPCICLTCMKCNKFSPDEATTNVQYSSKEKYNAMQK